jgi:hypothetical protein
MHGCKGGLCVVAFGRRVHGDCPWLALAWQLTMHLLITRGLQAFVNAPSTFLHFCMTVSLSFAPQSSVLDLLP